MGLHIADLARRSGLSAQTIVGLEKDTSQPWVFTLFQVHAALHGLPLETLLEYWDYPNDAASIERYRAGIQVRVRRQETGATVESLAAEVGASPEALYHLEHGTHVPSLQTLVRVIRGLGLELEPTLRLFNVDFDIELLVRQQQAGRCLQEMREAHDMPRATLALQAHLTIGSLIGAELGASELTPVECFLASKVLGVDPARLLTQYLHPHDAEALHRLNVGGQLREARSGQKISLRALSRRSKIQFARMRAIENGARLPSAGETKALEGELGIRIVFNGETTSTQPQTSGELPLVARILVGHIEQSLHSPEELATRANISPRQLQRLSSGIKTPELWELLNLADALQVSPTLLLSAAGQPTDPDSIARITSAVALRSRRKRAGLTQVQLAEASEVSVAEIRAIERAHHRPRIQIVADLSSGLKISARALLCDFGYVLPPEQVKRLIGGSVQRRLRREAGVTVHEAAAIGKVAVHIITKVEQGVIKPDPRFLHKIAPALRVPSSRLLAIHCFPAPHMTARNIALSDHVIDLIEMGGADLAELTARLRIDVKMDRVLAGTSKFSLGQAATIASAVGLDPVAVLLKALEEHDADKARRADMAGWLFRLRSAANWSHKEVGQATKTRGKQWSDLENGEYRASVKALRKLGTALRKKCDSEPLFADQITRFSDYQPDSEQSLHDQFAAAFPHHGYIRKEDLEYFRTPTPGAYASLIKQYLGFTKKEMADSLGISVRHWQCFVRESGVPPRLWLKRLLEMAQHHQAIDALDLEEVCEHFSITDPLSLHEIGIDLSKYPKNFNNEEYFAALHQLTLDTSAWDFLHATILKANSYLLRSPAWHFGDRTQEFEHRLQTATLVLSDAIDSYQEASHFPGYAKAVIKKGLIAEWRWNNIIAPPNETSQTGRSLQLIREALRTTYGAEPTIGDIASRLPIPTDVAAAFFARLDSGLPEGVPLRKSQEPMFLPQFLPLDTARESKRGSRAGSFDDPQAHVSFDRVDDQQELAKALGELTPEQLDVLRKVYFGNNTLAELANGDNEKYLHLRNLSESGMAALRRSFGVVPTQPQNTTNTMRPPPQKPR